MSMETTYISHRTGFWNKVVILFEIMGYSRAASELNRLGYYSEAKKCRTEIKTLRQKYFDK